MTLESVKGVFGEYDPQHIGRVTADSFKNVCEKMGVAPEDQDAIVS